MQRALQTDIAAADTSGEGGLVGWLASLLPTRTAGRTRRMRQIECLTLGPKRCLHLVECDGERFLVAAGGDGVSAPVALRQACSRAEETAG